MIILLALAVVSSVFQFYIISVSGVYLSIALVSGLALFIPIVFRRKVPKLPTAGILVLLILLQTLSLLWSPDRRLGLRTIVYMLPFLSILIATYTTAMNNEGLIYKIILLFAAFAAVETSLIILFRVAPGLERFFLKSSFAQIFISKNVLVDLYTTARNNVLDVTKAGGFFVNANVASTFVGSSAFVLWGAAGITNNRWLKLLAVMMLISVWFSGSKAGIALSVLLPMAYYIAHVRPFGRARHQGPINRKIAVVIITVLAGLVISIMGWNTLLRYTHNVSNTVGVRFLIWTYAWHSFLQSPILGQGFGGWQTGYPLYAKSVGISANYPPHNTLIYLWSQSGIFSAFLGLAFVASIILLCVQLYRLEATKYRPLVAGTLCAFCWMFIQGMGENFGLLGDVHMQPILALALGLLGARLHKVQKGMY